jgi:hypothetical protein
MKNGPDIASLAALIGDPARANMLTALMSGMALTAGELAREAGVTPQTASAHLAKLMEAKLVIVEAQGRHRYFKLGGPDVAGALEGLMELASRTGRMRTRPGPRDRALRDARVCYDHLAGTMGVRMYDTLIDQGAIIAARDGLGLSSAGRARFIAEGIDIGRLEQKDRPFAGLEGAGDAGGAPTIKAACMRPAASRFSSDSAAQTIRSSTASRARRVGPRRVAAPTRNTLTSRRSRGTAKRSTRAELPRGQSARTEIGQAASPAHSIASQAR